MPNDSFQKIVGTTYTFKSFGMDENIPQLEDGICPKTSSPQP
jgi:hypothetical protein